ncbi:hypothetical protein WH835_11220 [Raoultella planticola]|uniref:hypothetical protein n=1 Tax=Raoultella planticola TaxID=575 RepID=UPI00339C4751
MKQVTPETVSERKSELKRRISSGVISLNEEFELACLYKLLGLLDSRSVTVTLPPTIWAQFDDSPQLTPVLEREAVLAVLTAVGIKSEV